MYKKPWSKLIGMKNKIVPELISAAAIGAGFGLLGNHLHQKWHQLGRDAYLAHASQNFEKLYARQVSLPREVLEWTLLALVVYAVYKGLALLISKIVE